MNKAKTSGALSFRELASKNLSMKVSPALSSLTPQWTSNVKVRIFCRTYTTPQIEHLVSGNVWQLATCSGARTIGYSHSEELHWMACRMGSLPKTKWIEEPLKGFKYSGCHNFGSSLGGKTFPRWLKIMKSKLAGSAATLHIQSHNILNEHSITIRGKTAADRWKHSNLQNNKHFESMSFNTH